MAPSERILGTVVIMGWFIGTPFILHYGPKTSMPLWQGFAIAWGVPLGLAVLIAALCQLDVWWFRRKGGR